MSQNLKKLVIIGASGFGREVLWTISDHNNVEYRYNVLGYIDDDPTLINQKIHDLPVLGNVEWLTKNLDTNVKCVLAIGNCKIRKHIAQIIQKSGFSFETIIHPSVKYSKSVKIGSGTIIQAGCVITVDVTIGENVHMNLNTTVGHDSIIENFVTLNPGVHVNGNTTIGEGTYVGSGTVMKQDLDIGEWATIGAGTVLVTDVPSKTLFLWTPGKILKQ